MKRILACIMFELLLLSLCACGSTNNTSLVQAETTVPEPEPTTAMEALKESEQVLFDVLIQMASNEFLVPSEVRVLDVGDSFESDNVLNNVIYGDSVPDLLTIKLQGTRKDGNNSNQYYIVCIKAGDIPEKKDTYEMYEAAAFYTAAGLLDDLTESYYIAQMMQIKAEYGEYVQLDEDPHSFDSRYGYDVGRLNRALKEYWEKKGL